jgi:hypothetical protein
VAREIGNQEAFTLDHTEVTMRARSSVRWIVTAAAAAAVAAIGTRIAGGQPPQQHSSIAVFLKVDVQALAGRPAMVSAIRDGRIVEQHEVDLTTGRAFESDSIKVGVYDIRVEGEGLVTEVKRGVHAFAGQKTDLTFQMRPGKGVHIVEYATGALPREEIAARLEKLESQVAALAKARVQP